MSQTRYHHLARWSAPGRWRFPLGTVLIFVGTLVAGTVLYGGAMIVGQVADLPRDADDLPILPSLVETVLAFAVIAVGLPIALLTVRLVQRRPAGMLSSVLGRVRWRWLAWCLPPAFLTLAVMFVVSAFLPADPSDPADAAGAWVGGGAFLRAAALLVLVVPVQCAAEEYVFRGWLLQGVGALTSRLWPAILVQAVLFAAVHGWGTVWGFADLVVWACFMGWLTVRTGGLEASLALHAANNLFSMVWSVAFGLLNLEVTAADMPLELFLLDVPLVAGYVAVVVWLARWRKVPVVAVPAVAVVPAYEAPPAYEGPPAPDVS